MISLAIGALSTSSSSSSLSEHVEDKSLTAKVAEPIFSKFDHTHKRRRRRKVADESASVVPQPQSSQDRSIAKLGLVERCIIAIVRNEPLDKLTIEAAQYKDDDRPKITPEHLRSAIHAFSVEGMHLLKYFKWTGSYNVSEIIYTNLCSDINKAYTENRDGGVFINPEALLRVNRYALFIARLYKECKWDLCCFHKFYLTNIRTSYNYGPPAITLRCGKGLLLQRIDRAILKTVQETLELTPEKMLEGLQPWELDLAEKSSELGEFGITKDHFKAARLALKNLKAQQ